MQVTIFGATGSMGDYLVNEALSQDLDVVAVSRHHVANTANPHLRWQQADYANSESLSAAIKGSNFVLISLGDYGVVEPTQAIIEASKQAGIKRIEILTGFGTDPVARKQLGMIMRLAMVVIHRAITTKEKQSVLIRQSGLDFTNVQPPTLTFEPATHNYRFGNYSRKSLTGHISRADLAEFMITNLTQKRFINTAVFVQD